MSKITHHPYKIVAISVDALDYSEGTLKMLHLYGANACSRTLCATQSTATCNSSSGTSSSYVGGGTRVVIIVSYLMGIFRFQLFLDLFLFVRIIFAFHDVCIWVKHLKSHLVNISNEAMEVYKLGIQ